MDSNGQQASDQPSSAGHTAIYLYACTEDPAATQGVCQHAVYMSFSDLTGFQVSQLDPAQLGAAFSAGFIIVATGFVVGHGFAKLVNFITDLSGR